MLLNLFGIRIRIFGLLFEKKSKFGFELTGSPEKRFAREQEHEKRSLQEFYDVCGERVEAVLEDFGKAKHLGPVQLERDHGWKIADRVPPGDAVTVEVRYGKSYAGGDDQEGFGKPHLHVWVRGAEYLGGKEIDRLRKALERIIRVYPEGRRADITSSYMY
ncbi:MAG TPA: hypothetical protein VEC35_13210 [Noviherbaspirillum sp.]|nr:hypothetical protein [Noviherbaspirillum sp.]